MKALTVTDLSSTATLDARAMGKVRGGTGYYNMPAWFGPQFSVSVSDANIAASQSLGQQQNTLVNNGNNVAFASGITSNVNPTQNGSNNIHIL
ncbi:hypothetical protein [Noviherbaspirillum galbum]|uniref:Uncharacterized protein n=1 Tax=Noviherbaspirillum galbum TaxID=2709383 RepID=A0A6B3SSX7_9BURK|nr:hypothetical protein [Noviherbaspirillum galbum]NEX61936.1 hypothetical protein [Noviherbaspirillum galbum]